MKVILPIKGIKQKSYFCGPACIEMILYYYGYKVSQKEIGKILGTYRRRGTYTSQVIKYLSKYGIICKKVKELDIDKYLDKPRPLIIGFPQHFVLLIGRVKNYLVVLDPAHGRRNIVKRDYLNQAKDYIKIERIEYEN
jgi:ABC-type bacteriocin/lantibiotic exporter with double-glycine peptidase domain